MELAEALLRHGIRLPSYDPGQRKTQCPKCSHERSTALKRREPCLSVRIDDLGATWRCHHCGDEDSFLFKQKQQGTMTENIQKAGTMPVPAVLTDEQLQWFKDRGISQQTVEEFGIGNVNGYIGFPTFEGGRTVAMKLRKLPKQFTQVPGGKRTYFGINHLAPEPQEVVIVEGELDVLALAEAEVTAISVPDGASQKLGESADNNGKFSFVGHTWDQIDHAKRIVLAGDTDGPGLVMREELARRYGRSRCYYVDWPEGIKDANEMLLAHGKEALAAAIAKATPYPIKHLRNFGDYADQIMEVYAKGVARGVSTGFANLDEYYTIRPGELTVVTGYPGMGKSEFVDQLLINLSQREGYSFAVCSFENPPEQHAIKLIEKIVQRPFFDGPAQRASMQEVSDAIDFICERIVPIRFDDDVPTIDTVLDAARGAVGRHGIRGLVIDPYNELARPADLAQLTETEYVSQMIGRVKRFCQSHGVHGWFIAHPAKPYRSKDGNYPVPTLFDISGSMHFVNKMDNGIVIHRPDMLQTRTAVMLRKVRFKATGKPGETALEYDTVTGTYYEPSDLDNDTAGVEAA